MPYFGRGMRTCLLLAAALLVASCGRSKDEEIAASAAPVRQVVALLSLRGGMLADRCLCVGHFREDAMEDFPAGVLDAEYARHPWLRKLSTCEAYYGRAKRLKGCSQGLTEFICSVSDRSDLPRGTTRVICHVNGESEAMRKEGYLQDEYYVTQSADGSYVAGAISRKASDKIHE
jgi:hypothetical protein